MPRGISPTSPPAITEGPSHSRGGSALSKQQNGEGPSGAHASAAIPGLNLRGTAALIEARLATSVHPNPGPGVRRGRRGRGEVSRGERRERRHQRRRDRANARRIGGRAERGRVRGGGLRDCDLECSGDVGEGEQ